MDVTLTTDSWIGCEGLFSESALPGQAWVHCKNGLIQEIRSTPPDHSDTDSNIVEPGGGPAYLVPLLADTHVHFYMEPWPLDPSQRQRSGEKPLEEEIDDAIARVQGALAAGIGMLRDMGDPHGINLAVKRRFAAVDMKSPELLVAGSGMHRPKKYGRFLGVMRETVEDIKESINDLIDSHDVDYIKLVATVIVNFEEKAVRQSPQFSTAELEELVHYSHDRGRKVAAHCSGVDGLKIAIDAGVDFIEHAYFITDEQLARMIDKGLMWTPTFVPVYTQAYHDECGWSDEVRESIKEILAGHNRMVRMAHECGALLMAGTDAGCPGVEMGRGLRTELACMADSGISATQLLKMATVTNAELCGARQYSGRIEVGGEASFGVYQQPPWQDVKNLESLVAVYHHGEQVAGVTPVKSFTAH